MYKLNKQTLEYEEVKTIKIISYFVIAGLVFSAIGFTTGKVSKEEKIPVVIELKEEFSKELLFSFIKQCNIKFPEIVLKQAILESGNFTSHIFRENNNLFGMKVSSSRPTTHRGEHLNHAYYSSWEESVLDYALWQASFARKINTIDQYYQFLDEIYCDYVLNGKTYSQHLKSMTI
jgi:hypothetical protein